MLTSEQTVSKKPIPQTQPSPSNPLGLERVHHAEYWVGNAKQAAYYYRKAFGFSQIAYRGLDTGSREVASYVLEQGEARLVLSTALNSNHPIADHVLRHGDGIKDIAFKVADADQAFAEAVSRGAIPAVEPHDYPGSNGAVRCAAIRTYGDTIHSLISYEAEAAGDFLPGFVARPIPGYDAGLLLIDHIVGNVELGKMNEWASWYSDVLGFERYIHFDDNDISTEYSALMSIVMANNDYAVKFPINEPAEGRKKSQIEEYLDYYEGPGAQHLALQTADIVSTVEKLRAEGIEFLDVPDTYYTDLVERVGFIDENIEELQRLKILVDRDEEGYLLQIFTKPVEDRPTLFYEIIQRKGSRGFGKGNFKALFVALEAEQELRGNL